MWMWMDCPRVTLLLTKQWRYGMHGPLVPEHIVLPNLFYYLLELNDIIGPWFPVS
jgi:hypothetical protein